MKNFKRSKKRAKTVIQDVQVNVKRNMAMSDPISFKELRVWVEDEKSEGVILKISDDGILVKLEDGSQAICPPEAVQVIYEDWEIK